jgi:hypothetical protein
MRALQCSFLGCEVGRLLERTTRERPVPKYVKRCIVGACESISWVVVRFKEAQVEKSASFVDRLDMKTSLFTLDLGPARQT